MVGLIWPHATVEKNVVLPDGVQLGRRPPLSVINPEFPEPVYVSERRQVLLVGPVGSRADMVTAVYGQGVEHDQIYVYTGGFGGTLAMFEDAVLGRKLDSDPQKAQYALVIAMLRGLDGYRSR